MFLNYRILGLMGVEVLPDILNYNGTTVKSKATIMLKSLMEMMGLDQEFYPKCIIQKNYFRNKGDDHIIKYKESDCCTEIKTYKRDFDGTRGEHVAIIMPMCSGKSHYSRKLDCIVDVDTLIQGKRWDDPTNALDVSRHSLANRDKPLIYLLHNYEQKPGHIELVAQAKCGIATTIIRALRRGRTYFNWSRSLYNVISNWISVQIRASSTSDISDLVDTIVVKHCRLLHNNSYQTKANHYRAEDLPLESEEDRAAHASIIEKCFDLELPTRLEKNVLVSGIHMGKMAYQWSNATMKNLLSG